MRYVGERHIVIDDQPTPTPLWEPDRSFAGATVILIGGGPSLADLDLDLVRGRRFVVANSSCRRVRPIATRDDILYFTDNSWAENRPQLVAAWPGPVVTPNRNAKARLGALVRYIDVTALTMMMAVRADFAQASSGHIAACLIAAMGAARIVLFAFEVAEVDGRSHGHGDYTQSDPSAFDERFLPGWRGLAPAFQRLGVEVINATPRGVLDCFPRMHMADALRR